MTLTFTQTSDSTGFPEIPEIVVEKLFSVLPQMDYSSEERRVLEEHFKALVKNYEKLILRICFQFATGTLQVEDLYQDILINMWRGMAKLKGEAGLTTWVYRIVINTCISSFRSASRRPETEDLSPLRNMAAVDNTEQQDNVEQLHYLISRLSLLDRAIIMMWLDERDYDEIAEVTGISKSNVGVRIHRIKEKMKKDAIKNT